MKIGESDVEAIYSALRFPLREGMPYVVMNMVTTIDGKSVVSESGEEDEALGSAVDRLLMRRIEGASDAVLIGATTQRSSPQIHYDENLLRIVVTRSGNLLWESRFFTDAPNRSLILCPERTLVEPPISGVRVLRCGQDEVDWSLVLSRLYEEFKIRVLLVEGGAMVNGQLLKLGIVDELFLTLAPRIKLGKGLPTYADGEPFPAREMPRFRIVEVHKVADEMFLRYRRA
jgi:2,5-diamino-6-(ribosylamino)-4(3H)-pyrimidinone 5'-phosphate reductase